MIRRLRLRTVMLTHSVKRYVVPLVAIILGSMLVLTVAQLYLPRGEAGLVSRLRDPEVRRAAAAKRPVYPMSVVDGGVYTTAELRWRAAHDPVVGRSYAAMAVKLGDPDLLDNVRVASVPVDTRLYTQLRRDDKLMWSQKPVTVKQGEKAFYHEPTGKMVARARCGNALVASLPIDAVTHPEPPEPVELAETTAPVYIPPTPRVVPPAPQVSPTEEPPVAPETPLIPRVAETPSTEILEPPATDSTDQVPPIAIAQNPPPAVGGGNVKPSDTTSSSPDSGQPEPKQQVKRRGAFWWLVGGLLALLPHIDGGDDSPDDENPVATPELPLGQLLVLSAMAGGGIWMVRKWRRKRRAARA